MRYIRYLVLGVLAIILITTSIANREPLTLNLLPDEIAGLVGFNFDITLPVFAVILGSVIFGLALGFVWEWVREHKHRATAATERRERQRLESEVKKVAPSKDSGDDVLALLEGR